MTKSDSTKKTTEILIQNQNKKNLKGRKPQTGKVIKIAAKKVIKFKAGADLAGKV
ncbi:MAG: HU family DNA-binding protein [Bacteroidales bacterium]